MKKILFIISSLSGGGAEKVLITFLKNFNYVNFKVDLCLVNKFGVYLNDVPGQVRLVTLYDDPVSLKTKCEYNMYSYFGLDFFERRRIRKSLDSNYDAIISFCEGRSLKFHSYITDFTKNNITWVHTDMHNNHYSVGKNFKKKHELKAYGAMQTIVCVSENAKRQFDKEFPDLNVRKIVIVNPIPKEIISSYKNNIQRDVFTLTGIGRLSSEKAFDRAIRLAAYLKRKGYKFHINIIGEGFCRDELNLLIKNNNVLDCVSLLGFINPPYRELSCSDLFLNVSKVEAYPLVICEAMCLGIPVLATNTAGSVELLGQNGEYGLLVEQNDESIFDGVERLINNNELRNHYRKKSLERSESFDVEEVMKKVYALIL